MLTGGSESARCDGGPVEIVVACPGYRSFARDHVAIAAIDRISKKPFLNIRDHLFEERRAVRTFEFTFPVL